ncbi:MAG: hypothetical protein JSS87_07075 [Acidobacteria bacterium]|nr:hypothetical protein [Acidobacteriota bacterium]
MIHVGKSEKGIYGLHNNISAKAVQPTEHFVRPEAMFRWMLYENERIQIVDKENDVERREFLRCATLAGTTVLFDRSALAFTKAAPSVSKSAKTELTDVLAHVPGGNTVGGEVREKTMRSDGYFHIDTPRMIARLKELHVNTCNYLIWNSPSDWDDLRNEFLPAAEKAAIQVWTYMAPPAETYAKGKGSDPYRTNYEKWAEELAHLSLRYRSLKAWVMDDFTWNMKTFTPEYVARLQEITHAINPELRFFPVIHFTAMSAEWIRSYKPYIDGVVCPYIDLPYNNTQRTTSLNPSINHARETLGLPVYVLLYAGRHLTSPLEPTPEYITNAIQIGVRAISEGRCGGIISYGTELDPQPLSTQGNGALEGNGRLYLAAVGVNGRAGDFAQASQTIHIAPNSPRYQLSFWHEDNWLRPLAPKGQYIKQLLIDETVVWQCDVAADDNYWLQGSILQGPINLTSILKGRSTARLTIRLIAQSDGPKSPIQVSFDALEATGFTLRNPGFESSEAWHLEDKGQALLAAIDHFMPDLRRQVFVAVSREFARAQRMFASSKF